jgi:hypothetical protein
MALYMLEHEKPPLQLTKPKIEATKLLPNQGVQEVKKITLEKPFVNPQEDLLPKESTIFTAESIKKKAGEKLSDWADAAGAWLFLSLTELQIVRQIKPEYAEGFEEKFMEIMKDRDVVPMLIANHESLADTISMALISKKLTKLINKARGVDDALGKVIVNDLKDAFSGNLLKEQPEDKKEFPGWILTMAKSLDAGVIKGQGKFIQALTGQLNSWLRSNSMALDGYVRTKDKDKFNIPQTNMGYLRRLVESIEKGEGRAMFPQGSVESGRLANKNMEVPDKNPKLNQRISRLTQGVPKALSLIARELVRSTLPKETYLEIEKLLMENAPPIKGAQKFDETVKFDKILKITHNANKKMLFIVVGNSGAPKIIDHNTKQPIPTWEAWLANLNPLTPVMQILLGLVFDTKIKGLMDVNVGMPIVDTDMISEIKQNREDPAEKNKEPTSEEYSDYLGHKIAKLLPEGTRGVYK